MEIELRPVEQQVNIRIVCNIHYCVVEQKLTVPLLGDLKPTTKIQDFPVS